MGLANRHLRQKHLTQLFDIHRGPTHNSARAAEDADTDSQYSQRNRGIQLVRFSSATTRSVGNAVLLMLACCFAAQALGESSKGANQVAAAVVQRPNVLFIAVDDLRPELGCYDNQEILTPHFDQFSRGATTFMRAYCR